MWRRDATSKILRVHSVFFLSLSLLASHLFLFKSRVVAQTVMHPTVITASSVNSATPPPTQRKIVQTLEGTIHAFIQTGTTTMNCGGTSKAGLLWATSDDDGATWSCQDQLTSTTSVYASTTVDSSDNLYAVYSRTGNGASTTYDIFYRKFSKGAGSNWTMEAQQTALDGLVDNGYTYGVVKLEGSTRLWLAIRFFYNTEYRVKAYYSDGLGTSPVWTESAELDTAGTSTGGHIPTLVRFGTNMGAIYTDNSSNIKWRTRADSDGLTSWNAETNVGTGEAVRYSSLTDGAIFSAAVDDNNQVHVNYITTSPYKLNYTFYNGSSWSTPTSLVSSNISDSSGAQITTDGTSVWVIWNDGSGGMSFNTSSKGKLSHKKGVSPFTSSDFDTDPTAVNSADRIYDQVWTYISSSYTDETTDAGNTTTADVAMPSVVDDIIYFGMTEKFRAVSWYLSTWGSDGIVAWEYYNGSSWTNLTLVKFTNRYFTNSPTGAVYFDPPSNWTQTQVNTDTSPGFYYVRARITSDYTTTPVGTQMAAIPGCIAISAIAKFSTSRAYLIWAETASASAPANVQFATIATNQNPNAPSSLGPSSLVDGSFRTDNTPTLTFTLSDPDESEQVKYQIRIDDDSNFSSAVVDYTSALGSEGSASFTVGQAEGSGSYTTGSEGQTLPDGSYYWRVKTIDDDDTESAYTTANSGNIAFKLDATTPSKPGTPSTTSPTFDKTPSWSWSVSTDTGSGLRTTNTYKTQWSKSASFASAVNSAFTNTNSFTHSSPLSAGIWYLRVRAFDALGNISSWSSTGEVAIGSLPAQEEKPPGKEEKEEEKEIIVPDFFDIIIHVVDKEGNPVEGARVELYSEPKVAYTDFLGEVYFSEVEKGAHRILVFFRDQRGETTIHAGPRPGEVYAASEGPEVITIQLEPFKPDLVINPKLIAVICASYLLGVLTMLFVFKKGRRRG